MKLKTIISLLILAIPLFATSTNVNQEWFKKLLNKSQRGDLHVITDSEGYIYAAGTFNTGENGTDWLLIKLSPNSDTLFQVIVNSEINGDDYVNAIATDIDDNVYLTGSLAFDGDKTSVALYKILSNGEIAWNVVSNTEDGINEGSFILTDSSNNVYVGGNLHATNNSDIFLRKYDENGDEDWNYSINSSDAEKIKGLKACNNGNLVIAYDILESGKWSIGVTCVDEEGDQVYQSTFDGPDNGNDQCNDLAIDNYNQPFVGGYATNNGNKDYLTIRFKSTGGVEWYALFDEEELDDEIVSLKTVGNCVVVTGNCLADDSLENHNIITIMYSNAGVQQWKQTFKGGDSGDDLAVKLISNCDSEIVVAGQVWFNQSDYDLYLINYGLDGDLLWSIKYNDTLNYPNLPSDIAIDFLGNIYCAVNSVNGDNITGEIIKFNQPPKFIPVMKDFLKKLTVGLLDIAAETEIKNYVYNSCAMAVDSFFHIDVAALIDSCEGGEIDLKTEMNEKIADFFSLSERDYVDYILKRFWVMGYKRKPMIAVPHYHHFTSTQLEDDPKLGYAYEEQSYPIPCLNCDSATIDKAGTEAHVTWLVLVQPAPWYYINGNPLVYISSCLVSMNNINCQQCSTTTSGPIGPGTGPSMQHHEFELTLGQSELGVPAVMMDDGCYGVITPTPSYYPPPNTNGTMGYARLTGINNLPFYKYYALPNQDIRVIKKEPHPIVDRLYNSYWTLNTAITNTNNWLPGDILTICHTNPLFNTPGGDQCRYALAHGLYRVDRPGTNQKPLYFAIPFAEGIWFTQGPDMSIFYASYAVSNTCPTGLSEITDDYFTQICEFCNVGAISIASNIKKYIASTNASEILNYWSAPVVSVGFRTHTSTTPAGGSNTPGLNLHDFTAINNPTPCTPSGTLVVQLTLSSSGEYEVSKNFDSNATFAPNTALTIHVIANYKDGKSINECRTVTLISNDPSQPTLPFRNIVLNVRGNIKDYNSSVINFQVSIYQ